MIKGLRLKGFFLPGLEVFINQPRCSLRLTLATVVFCTQCCSLVSGFVRDSNAEATGGGEAQEVESARGTTATDLLTLDLS